MTHPTPPRNAKNEAKMPVSWLLLIIFLGILYSFFQPWANAKLGLNLPAIGQLIAPDKKPSAEPSKPETKSADSIGGRQADARESDVSARQDTTSTIDVSQIPDEAQQSPYKLLKSLGSEVYLSEAGLRYTRGSEEGHRLEHLARHLKDMPERSGSHGVFEGGWQVVLQRIDETYRRSRNKDPRTKIRQEERRSVIETEFSESIGYVGGREGAKKGKPSTRRLRLVTEGDRFITAFPF